jgi:hypothetical protein
VQFSTQIIKNIAVCRKKGYLNGFPWRSSGIVFASLVMGREIESRQGMCRVVALKTYFLKIRN